MSKKTWLLFEENKNYISKQEATEEGLFCLQVFRGHLCLLIWTQHSLRRDWLKFRQLVRVQFCVSETRIHVFAFYSKMPACIYLIFKITVVFIFISFEIILVSQKSAKSNKVFQCSLCIVVHVLLF